MSKRRGKSSGGQKAWLDSQLLAHLEYLAKNATRFEPARISLGVVTNTILPALEPGGKPDRVSDPYGLGRLDEQRRVLLVEGAARRLERQGLVVFHPHSKKIERAKSLLEVLAYVSRDDEEIRETG